MNDLSHLTEHVEETPQDLLEKITFLAEEHKHLKKMLDYADEQAKQAKKDFNKVSMEMLPEAMMQAGMSSFEMDDGSKVSYKEELTASVKDYTKLEAFLEERGDDGILKVSFEVGKLPKNITNAIMKDLHDKYGIDADVKVFVHSQTLKAYFSRLCGIKKGSTAEMTIGDIDEEMVSTFTFYKSKIK
jgi:hypothetical protein